MSDNDDDGGGGSGGTAADAVPAKTQETVSWQERRKRRMSEQMNNAGHRRRAEMDTPRPENLLRVSAAPGEVQRYTYGPEHLASNWRVYDPESDTKVDSFDYPTSFEEQAALAPSPLTNPWLMHQPESKISDSMGPQRVPGDATDIQPATRAHKRKFFDRSMQRAVLQVKTNFFLPPHSDVSKWCDDHLLEVT